MRAPAVEEITRWIRLTHARRAAMRAAHDATLAEGTLEALVAANNGGTNRFDELRTPGACSMSLTTTPGRAAWWDGDVRGPRSHSAHGGRHLVEYAHRR